MGRCRLSKYLGSYFIIGKAKLTVIGVTEGAGRKKLILECDVCSKDKELFYYGSITSNPTDLAKGKVPCGCSNSTRTEEQNKILANRAAESKGLVFLGWGRGGYNKKKTLVRLYNPALKYCWDTTVLQYLLSTNNLCCPETRRLGNRRSNIEEFLQKAKSAYPAGTEFERDYSGKLDVTGRDMYWIVSCPLCGEDEYTLNGISDGKFRVSAQSLRSGQVSCRCAGARYQRTYEEYVYWIRKRGGETGYHLDTSRYNTFTSRSLVRYSCPYGHPCETRLGVYLHKPACGVCSKGGFDKSKPASFYIVRWYGYTESYIKFGITNRDVMERILEQDVESKHLDYKVLYMFHHESGKIVMDCERLVKQSVNTSVCSKELLPDGYTETTEDTPENLSKLLNIISTFNLQEQSNDKHP